jgi:hypothetical protein
MTITTVCDRKGSTVAVCLLRQRGQYSALFKRLDLVANGGHLKEGVYAKVFHRNGAILRIDIEK